MCQSIYFEILFKKKILILLSNKSSRKNDLPELNWLEKNVYVVAIKIRSKHFLLLIKTNLVNEHLVNNFRNWEKVILTKPVYIYTAVEEITNSPSSDFKKIFKAYVG